MTSPWYRRARRSAATASLALTAGLLTATTTGAPAQAATVTCPPVQAPVQIGDAGVALEGAVVDNAGRLFVTDLFGGRVLRFDKPGAAPVEALKLPVGGGGALALRPDGTLLVGGGANPKVFLGDVLKPGVIYGWNQNTGALTTVAKGFSAADGLAVAHDGTIYATNDFGTLIGRVTPDGTKQADWARLPSANGAVLNHDDSYLYVSRTFWNPGVSRIPVAHPDKPESLLDLTFPRTFAAPDGLTIDSQDRPVVPTDVGGKILRIEKPGVTCTLATGVGASSVIVYGHGTTGFLKGHLYRAGFDGKIYEIPAGFDPGA
ncbi:SMP-30/gluconolactonase/LRE family protein [Spongisporangium articulatum]|uniref:SMP-30/gluconolactonase/LRE family protein n=1 Tax=Spongisporangium articulatum TaxID=3362603 RepID=A0ABW8AJN0_9ACTN